MFSLRLIVMIFSFFTLSLVQAATVIDYLPSNHTYNKAIPTPYDVFGFGLGDRHIRYDQLFNYIKAIDKNSARIQTTSMGRTNQFREQLLVTISSEKNLAKLDLLLNSRADFTSDEVDEPLIIWLGYSVHGDELSGANAALAVIYHLVASEDKSINAWLEDTIIVMEPSSNPDGMDRFVSWISNNIANIPNSDTNHMEHHQGWRTGRSNHFGFDLNRDWLLLSQVETQNRMAYFQRYQPHVVGDFHELGSDRSYFFQPGVATRINPLTPKSNIELTHSMATYHAKAFDKEDRLYFSKEQFDDFYYGKGSTYPDINGSVGILFEQASSKGMSIDTNNGLLTLEYGIKNHVLTSLSTIEGAWINKDKFINHRKSFYESVDKQVKKEEFTGYLITEENDNYRLAAFLNKLEQHNIDVYKLTDDFKYESTVFNAAYSYYIPLNQPKYKVIKTLFDTPTTFVDNTFYDVSGWTLPLAMNIDFHKIESSRRLTLDDKPWKAKVKSNEQVDEKTNGNAYAYAFKWDHFLAPKLLNELLNNNIKAKVATKNFTAVVDGEKYQFDIGSIVIPAIMQKQDYWYKLLVEFAHNNEIPLIPLTTGKSVGGVDLGSPSLKNLSPVNVLLVGGKGVSASEAGEIQFYLDKTLNIITTVVEKERLNQVDLGRYTHIVMASGNYQTLNPIVVLKLQSWLKNGGVLFSQKYAAKWLADKDILKASFVSQNQIKQLFDTSKLSYEDKDYLAARQRIAGAIYETELDISHPLTFGFKKKTLPVYKNSTLIMKPLSYPFTNVGTYTQSPLMSGYTDKNLINKIANTSSLIAHNVGEGRVIATTDNLVFRGYWYGSAKLLANSLFFGKVFSAPITR